MALEFPALDPVMVQIGPIAIRWYAMAYLVGLVGGWRYVRWLVSKPPFAMSALQVDDFLVWATLGTVLGGRLGYVLFYKPSYFLANPVDVFALWTGGMSFHGGLIGVVSAIVLFSWRHKLDLYKVGDAICCAVPIGLFFGRIANFINGELFGRPAPSDLPWAMIFPHGGPFPRHPSQLYEALLEGVVLLAVEFLLWRIPAVRNRPGFLAGTFLIGYGLARITAEFFREPDAFLGFLLAGATMGQLLSLPLVLAGGLILLRALRRPAAAAA